MLYKDTDNQMDSFPAVSSQHFFIYLFFLTISGLPASVLGCPVAPSDQLLCIMSLPRPNTSAARQLLLPRLSLLSSVSLLQSTSLAVLYLFWHG